jgi:hypothetical protein
MPSLDGSTALLNECFFVWSTTMTASRYVSFAVLAAAALGFNAHAQSDRDYPPEAPTTSTLSRAEVQSEAIQAAKERARAGYVAERDGFTPEVAPAPSTVSREQVREEAIKAARERVRTGDWDDERSS